MASLRTVVCEYICPNPKCGAVHRDHGAEGATFAQQNCPRCGALMGGHTFYHVEVDDKGKPRKIARHDHAVR